MSDFFGRLETELRGAAERKPRWTVPVPAMAVAALLALAVAPIVFVLGSGSEGGGPERRSADDESVLAPVGSTMPKNDSRTSRRRPADTTVVATGVAPVSGPWQLEIYENDYGQCLDLFLVELTAETIAGSSPICPGKGRFPLRPFHALAMAVPPIPAQKEFLVYGPVPARASAVQLVATGEVVARVGVFPGPGVQGDFYVMWLEPDLKVDGWMEWLDESGNPGEDVRFRLP